MESMFTIGRVPLSFSCSLAEIVRLLGGHGLALYGVGELDAMFVRADLLGKMLVDEDSLRVGAWDPSPAAKTGPTGLASASRAIGLDEEACYREVLARGVLSGAQRNLMRDWLAMLRNDSAKGLRRVWCNITLHDRLLGLEGIPFSLSLA